MDKNLQRFYERREIEIQIIDECNLHCKGCNHLACLTKESWFISLDDFKLTVDLIVKNLSTTIKRLMIVGGEPLLHPQIKEIIQYLDNSVPKNIKVDILTNGIILDQNPMEYLSLLENSENVQFNVTQYPTVQYKELDKIESGKIGYLATRVFFDAPIVSKEPLEYSTYSNCGLYVLPCLIVRDFKVYICPLAACNNILDQNGIHISFNECDYLDLYTINEEKIINFIKSDNKTLCRHCIQQGQNGQFWAQGNTKLEQLKGEFTNQNGYFLDYEEYNQLYNGAGILPFLNKEKRWGQKYNEFLDEEFMIQGWKHYQKGRFTKKIDIIIPYYNINQLIIDRLKRTLFLQTFLSQCHIYLISDASPYEDLVFSNFQHFSNVTFLRLEKNQGPGIARQYGIDNSYNPYFTFLDCDDEYQYPEALEHLYDAVLNNDFAFGYVNVCDNKGSFQLKGWSPTYMITSHSVIYNRKFIVDNKIKFPENVSVYEDLNYRYQVESLATKIGCTKTYTYKYNKDSYDFSIGKTTSHEYKIEQYCLSLLAYIRNYWNKQENNEKIKHYIHQCLISLFTCNNNFDQYKNYYIYYINILIKDIDIINKEYMLSLFFDNHINKDNLISYIWN